MEEVNWMDEWRGGWSKGESRGAGMRPLLTWPSPNHSSAS